MPRSKTPKRKRKKVKDSCNLIYYFILLIILGYIIKFFNIFNILKIEL